MVGGYSALDPLRLAYHQSVSADVVRQQSTQSYKQHPGQHCVRYQQDSHNKVINMSWHLALVFLLFMKDGDGRCCAEYN
jgi:hypothetical protein